MVYYDSQAPVLQSVLPLTFIILVSKEKYKHGLERCNSAKDFAASHVEQLALCSRPEVNPVGRNVAERVDGRSEGERASRLRIQ